ncbi:hypothetical protein CANINC_000671 [Pichia inconspicua]|uniref:Uncharacterized protein n=1 Tax=Pichia inconspicua TaxID=52247 RepID=A0A4T0X618_9ASCO|nr:hypothetical protein CANINC_000671 [[Candida] inconspicua]
MLERDLKNTHISDTGGNRGLKKPELPPQDVSAPRTLSDKIIDQSKNVLNYSSIPEGTHHGNQARYPYPDEETPGPSMGEIQKQSSNLDSNKGNTKYANYHYSSLVDPVVDDSKVRESEMKINQYAQQKKFEESQREVPENDSGSGGGGSSFLRRLSTGKKNKDGSKAGKDEDVNYETYYDENRDSYVSTPGRQSDVKTRHTGIQPGMDSTAAGNYKVETEGLGYGGYTSQDPKIVQKNVSTVYGGDNLEDSTPGLNRTELTNSGFREDVDDYDDYPEDIKQQQRDMKEKSTGNHQKHENENGGLLSTIGNYLGITSDNNEDDFYNDDVAGKDRITQKEPTDMPGGLVGGFDSNVDDNTGLQRKNVANTNTYKDDLNSRSGVVETMGVVGTSHGAGHGDGSGFSSKKLQSEREPFQSDLAHPSGSSPEKNYQNAQYHHQREELEHRGVLKDHQRRRSYDDEAADLKAAMAYSGGKSPTTTTRNTFGTHESQRTKANPIGEDSAKYNTSGGVLLASGGDFGKSKDASGGDLGKSKDVTTDLKTESAPYRLAQNPENKRYLQEKDSSELKSDKRLTDDKERATGNKIQGENGGKSYLTNAAEDRRTYGQSYTTDGIDSGIGYANAPTDKKSSNLDTSRNAKLSRDAGYEDFDKLAGGESTDPPQITEDGGYYAGTRTKMNKSLSGSDFNQAGTNEPKTFIRNSEGKVPRKERNTESEAFTSTGNDVDNINRQDHKTSDSSSSSGGLGSKIKKVLGVDKKKQQHEEHSSEVADPNVVFQKNDTVYATETGVNRAGTGTGAYHTTPVKGSNNAGNPQYDSTNVPRNFETSNRGDSFHRNEGYTLREGQEQTHATPNQGQHRRKSLVDTIKHAF